LDGLSCPSPSLCVAVDYWGRVISSTDPGAGTKAHWTQRKHVERHYTLDFFNSIWCASTSLCVAADEGGNVITSTNPAAGRSATWSREHVDGSPLLGITCASTSFCIAVDKAGDVLSSTNPGAGSKAAWTAGAAEPGQGPNYGASESCPSAALCVLANSSGDLVSSTHPADGYQAAWMTRNVDGNPFAGTGYPLSGVSCSSASLCVATDLGGNVITSSDPGDGDSARWSVKNVLGHFARGYYHSFSGISCPATSLCVGVGDFGQINEIASSTNPAAGVGARWRVRHIRDRNGELGFVSCPSPTLCFVADATGSILIGRPSRH